MRMKLIQHFGLSVTAIFAAMLVTILATTPRISLAQNNGNAPREIHMCSLLTMDDVAPLLGGKQLAQETKGGTTCMWGDPGNDPTKLRLLIQAPTFAPNTNDPLAGVSASSRDKMEGSFKANRKQAFDDKDAHAKNEPQLGGTAFSALTENGAEIIILKKNGLLNIQLLTGKRGTPENVDSIRKVAAKVAASF